MRTVLRSGGRVTTSGRSARFHPNRFASEAPSAGSWDGEISRDKGVERGSGSTRREPILDRFTPAGKNAIQIPCQTSPRRLAAKSRGRFAVRKRDETGALQREAFPQIDAPGVRIGHDGF